MDQDIGTSLAFGATPPINPEILVASFTFVFADETHAHSSQTKQFQAKTNVTVVSFLNNGSVTITFVGEEFVINTYLHECP